MKEKKSPFSKTLLNLVLLIPNLISVALKLSSLVGREARLAGKSFIIIIGLAIFSACLFTSTWICMLGLLYIYFQSLLWSPAACLLIILLINILVLLIIGLIMYRMKNNLFFPETCEECRSLCKTHSK